MGTAKRICRRLWLCTAVAVHAQAFAFDIDDLRELVRDEQLVTVADVIARLPAEYRNSYTLAYDSRSLQGASRDNPRALLFGRTAQLVLTFNGDPSQPHYNTIEAMQFREGSETFELYSIRFGDGPARFSPPNPEVCSSCHGSPPRPIWSSYEYGDRETRHWPGFYGSTHDAPVLDPAERSAFERFRRRAASHPRYRHLVLSNLEAPWFPYGTGPTEHRLRPNNRLGNLLARWHARQIEALIERAGFVERHPGVAKAWLLQCPGAEGESFRRRVRALFDARFPPNRYRWPHARLEGLPEPERPGFMMERLLTGLADFHWDMRIEGPAGGPFNTGITTLDRFVGARWLATLDDGDPLKRYYRPRGSRELYDAFTEGYYEINVQPGGVGRAYDRVAEYYDESRARQACPGVMREVAAGTAAE